MKYVALLRGVNVGGSNKIDMKQLKSLFEYLGMESVHTYINSGNVIFESKLDNDQSLSTLIEEAIYRKFGLPIKVLVVRGETVEGVVRAVPEDWTNDSQSTKCDVLFLWPEIDDESVLSRIDIRPVDEVHYVPGAIVWNVNRQDYGRSGMSSLIGSDVYRQSTVRNINTVRKLANLLQS